MPRDPKPFDLEQLKVDPRMWMRLAVPSENGKKMESVFSSTDNPFEKNGSAAMDKVRKLAEEGKLYLREEGRSRHYRQLEKDEEGYKLTGQKEAELDSPYDPFRRALMQGARWYANRLGLSGLTNWFDNRLERHYSYQMQKDAYKNEYSAMNDSEKDALKAQRKEEKQERLEKETDALVEKYLAKQAKKDAKKAEKEAKKAEKEAKKAEKEEKKDPEKKEPEKKEPEKKEPVKTEPTKTEPTKTEPVKTEPEKKEPVKTEPEKKEPEKTEPVKTEPVANQPEKTEPVKDQPVIPQPENLREEEKVVIPPEVLAGQQQEEPQQEAPKQEEPKQEAPAPKAAPAKFDINRFSEELRDLPPEVLQQIAAVANGQLAKQQNPEAEQLQQQLEQNGQENPEKGELDAPLNKPPENLKEEASIQPGRPADTATAEKPTLLEQLAQEKQGLEKVRSWRETLFDSLFHSQVNKSQHDSYGSLREEPSAFGEGLVGVVCGMVGRGPEVCSPQDRQQILGALSGGTPLDSQFNRNIQEGAAAFKEAQQALQQGDAKPMSQMLSNTLRELTQAASAQTNLSEKHIMIGRMISQTIQLADQDPRIKLDLNEQELTAARGAVNLAVVAGRNMRARQHLGSLENIDMADENVRESVRDLLVGKAVERGLHRDKFSGETVSTTQTLMGTRIWEPQQLSEMASSSGVRKNITAEQVQAMLAEPQGKEAQSAGIKVINHMLKLSMEQQANLESPEMVAQKQTEMDISPKEQEEPLLQQAAPFMA